MNVLTWIIFSLVIVVSYLYLSGTSGYDGAPGTVEPPPPPPSLFYRNSRHPPPNLFSRKTFQTLFDKARQQPKLFSRKLPPTLFDKAHQPPKLFSRKRDMGRRRDMGGPWRGMMPQKICIDIS